MFQLFPKQAQRMVERMPTTSIELYAQKECVDLVKKVIFATCGQQIHVFTVENGALNGKTQMIFDVPTALADKVTVRIILSLPGNSVHGLHPLH